MPLQSQGPTWMHVHLQLWDSLTGRVLPLDCFDLIL